MPLRCTPVPHNLASRIPDAATLSSATLARLDAGTGTKRAFASLPTAPEIRRLTVNPAIRAVALSLLRRVASASASASAAVSPRVAASVAARACSFATVLRRRSSLHRCSAKSALAFWSSSSSSSDCAAACAWQSPNTVSRDNGGKSERESDGTGASSSRMSSGNGSALSSTSVGA